MLIKFTVKNFLSFKEEAVLDMTADALKEQKEYTHIPTFYNHKLELLKSAVMYGHNAAGKSNLLDAYKSYRNFILTSFSLVNKRNEVLIEPFLLNTSTIDKPSRFESSFIIKQTKYRYGFEIEKQTIIGEWLYYADGPVRENILFSRGGTEFGEISKSWNKNSDNRIEQTKVFAKSNNLFLSVLLEQEGIPRIDEIGKWFRGNIVINANQYESIVFGAGQIYSNINYRNTILRFIDNADLGFTSIFEKISNIVSESGLHPDVANLLYDIEKSKFELYAHHNVYDEHGDFVKKTEFSLLKRESTGSIKFFMIACYLSYAVKTGQLIWIDELDASIHVQLLLFLIGVFNSEQNNTAGSQLIFTTHNTVLLDNHLRRDQIWFVEKNDKGESTILKGHTPETPIRINKSIEQDYRSGDIKKGTSKKIKIKDLPSLFDDNI